MESRKGSFFERLARNCARHPWQVVIAWVMLFALGAALFATVFNDNMTTVMQFTTDTESKKADDLFKERFPQAAYKLENAVITSDTYTADNPEFWAYVDDLYARLQPLMDSGIVKDVQYYDPALREGLPLMPGITQQMVDAIKLVVDNQTTPENLAQAAIDLQASAAELTRVANGLTDNLTANGQAARDGMLEAADGAEELAATLLLRDGIQKLFEALDRVANGEAVSDELLGSTVTDLRDTAPTLRTTATYLEDTGPGTANRPTLIAGLRDTANGLEEVAGLYWLRYGITKTNNALRPIAEGQTITTVTCRATSDLLRDDALKLRAAADALVATGPGTVTERPTLINGLRDAANGLEEVAGLYWLRDGLTKTYNALKPIVDGQDLANETRQASVQLLRDSAPALRDAASELERTGPGTVDQRPTLIDGLRQTADGLEELAGLYEGLYWLGNGLSKTYNALRPIVDNQTISTETCRATAAILNNTALELRTAADSLAAFGPSTPSRDDLVVGLRQAANGLEEVAGLYWLRDGLTKTYDALVPMAAGDPLTDETRDSTTALLWDSPPEMRAAADALAATGIGTSDIFAVGSDGAIRHFDGVAWTPMTSETTGNIISVWGDSSDNVFAVGVAGTIQHYDGSTWSSMVSNTTIDLHGVWGSSSSDVFAVGVGGTVMHYDGSIWNPMTSHVTDNLSSVWGAAPDSVFAVGTGGRILHYNGSTWSSHTSGVSDNLSSVWGTASNDVFAIGTGGRILHYNGSTWSPMTSSVTDNLSSVWGTAPDSVFAVGTSGTILHYDGSTWSPMTSGIAGDLCAVWCNAGFDVYVAGNSGVILRYDGSTWIPMTSSTTNTLCGLWGTCARTDLISGIRQAADGMEEVAGVYELKNCAQKGLAFALMMTPDPLPTAAQVDPAVDEMPVTVARLRDAVARLEATGPGTPARPDLIDGLNQAADELEANLSNAEMLRGLVDGRPLTDLLLYAALVLAQPTIQAQAATAQAGLDQIQSQCADNIGQVAGGLTQLQTQCADNIGEVEAGLAQLGEQFDQVEAGLADLRRQCSDNLCVTAAGLDQMQAQCSDQKGTAEDGLTEMYNQLAEQLPTAEAGVKQAESGNVQAAGLVSEDRHTTLFIISMSEDGDEAAKHITELRTAVLTGSGVGLGEDSFEDGFRVRMVGSTNVSQDMQDVALSDLKKSLTYAIPIALVVLIIIFGTLVAATLPLVLSIVSIIVALGIAAVLGMWMPMNFAIQNIVFMLGLALGIDHALFVTYRYREERRNGRSKIDAIAKAGGTAGHAIFYAGLIVVIAYWGIFIIPCNMHKSLALGAIIVVLAIAPASMTLLPAILSLMGNRLDWGRLPWQKRITERERPTAEGSGFWHWVTRPAMKFTLVSLLLCIAILIISITPMFHMRLSYSYVDTLPKGCISRSGFDAMMEAGYGSYLVAPVEIAIDGYDKPEVKAETEALIQRLNDDNKDEEGSSYFITEVPIAVNDTGDVAWKRVFLNMDPFTSEASDKIKQLQNEFIGGNFEDAGGEALVTGYGSLNNDFVAVTENYTTPVLIFVLGLSFLLMVVVFRSILFAVVCTVFNLLSVYAAYGLVVFVFQDGNSGGFYQHIQGIDAYVPIFLLCGLFGISMDYFVFVLSRNRERYDQTGNMSEAIMFAFRRTGLVVLGAAAVMLVVFFAFSVSQMVIVAELGFGLVAAVFIDATLISLVMSPATMKLLGKWFWWWPRSLNWVPDLRAKPASEATEVDGSDHTAPEGAKYAPEAAASSRTDWPPG